MATEYIREKLNILGSLLQNSEMEKFQHELHVEVATKPTGDAGIDANLQAQASNAKAQILSCLRRSDVYRGRIQALTAEMNAATEKAETGTPAR